MQQNMNLSMTPYTQAGNFVCSQYDVGRECQITLQDENGNYTIPTGATVTIQATKPSGFGFSVECTWSGSTVTFATTETMTSEFGRFPAELRIASGNTVLGTTNFYFKVERSPHPEGTVDGDSETAQALTLRVDTLETEVSNLKSDIGDLEDLETTDKSSLVGAINEAKSSGGTGVPSEVRQAMLTLFESAAYAETGLTDEIAIVESWAEAITSITLNQSAISISGANTSQLVATTTPSGGTVTWTSSDTSVATVSSAGLVTGIGNGTATITASCGGLSARCTATVSGFATLTSISAVYTQSGTVYDTDSLDDLKSDLVVTATYSDSTTATITGYTLSGTLTEGTSTITVTYGGKTDTFTVTVSHVATEEVLEFGTCSTAAGEGKNFDQTTLDDVATSNEWMVTSSIQASTLTFSWDTSESDAFQIAIGQYDSNGTPYKVSNLNRYSSNPITDGSSMTWANVGSSWFYTAISGGNIQITLPASGVVKIAVRKSNATGTMNTNALFAQWLTDGGLTITAHV